MKNNRKFIFNIEREYKKAIKLHKSGNIEQAINIFDKLIEIKPAYEIYISYGELLINCGMTKEALVCFKKAIMIEPNEELAYNKIADTLVGLGSVELANMAIAYYRKSLGLDYNNVKTFNKLGLALHNLGKQEEAIDCFKKAIKMQPAFLRARFNLCVAQIPVFYATEEEVVLSRTAYRQELENLQKFLRFDKGHEIKKAAEGDLLPFYLAYQGQDDCELQRTYGELLIRLQAVKYPQFSRGSTFPPVKPREQIRVGLVSSHFYDHVDWNLIIKGWVENLNQERYRLLGYSTGGRQDKTTEVTRQKFSRFTEGIYDPERLGRIIRNDRLHILIYPEVGMNLLTAQLAALRLAPIQCLAWGHPTTSGLPTLDYFLSSDLMEPPGAEVYYTERLVRLPNLSIYCSPPDLPQVSGDRASFGLPADGVLFLCAQSLCKYLPHYDEVFPRIAQELGKCHFVFKEHQFSQHINDRFRHRLAQAFARYGLDREDYVTLVPRLDRERYVALYRLADIFLDSIGYSGFATTLDAIAVDLPIVTIPGSFMRGRQSMAILTMMEVGETIAATVNEYVSRAIRLGQDGQWRRQIARKIASSKHKLYNDLSCISGLEAFMEGALKRFRG
jgi:protein O-GlcNAc transferase